MTRAPSLAVAAALIAATTTAACKSKATSPPPPPTGGDAGTALALGPDADLPELAVPDEDALRAGKRTGLGAPDELPEVATEDFVAALIDGRQPWRRVVDTGAGVVELRTLDGDSKAVAATMGRRCGAELTTALDRLTKAATSALGDAALGYHLACDNSGLTTTDGVPVATCSIDADADGAFAFDLLFAPDPTLGLRLIGITLLDATPPAIDIADAFDVELGRPTRC
ncbi:MAG: hypothetical protein IPL61_28515 [Myxococcales bacterium]|nr:hypothetical protein [Myxococcales bacterium]